MLIGSPKEQSKKLNTKDNVDLAGLSLLLLHLNHINGIQLDHLETFLNKNSFHVIPVLIKDVAEVGNI
jgi:hypothetical protein